MIQELNLYKFEMSHNATKSTKNINYAKIEGSVNHSTVTRGFKKIRSVCKNLKDQAMSSRSKSRI